MNTKPLKNWIDYANLQEHINPGHGRSLLIALGYSIQNYFLKSGHMYCTLKRDQKTATLEIYPQNPQSKEETPCTT